MQLRGGPGTAATSKMEHFVIIVNGFQPLTIVTKSSILDIAAVLDPPLQLILKVEKPTAQTYFEKKFKNPELELKVIYTLPIRVTTNTNLRIFQYRLLHNILYLDEMSSKFGKKVSQLCSF